MKKILCLFFFGVSSWCFGAGFTSGGSDYVTEQGGIHYYNSGSYISDLDAASNFVATAHVTWWDGYYQGQFRSYDVETIGVIDGHYSFAIPSFQWVTACLISVDMIAPPVTNLVDTYTFRISYNYQNSSSGGHVYYWNRTSVGLTPTGMKNFYSNDSEIYEVFAISPQINEIVFYAAVCDNAERPYSLIRTDSLGNRFFDAGVFYYENHDETNSPPPVVVPPYDSPPGETPLNPPVKTPIDPTPAPPAPPEANPSTSWIGGLLGGITGAVNSFHIGFNGFVDGLTENLTSFRDSLVIQFSAIGSALNKMNEAVLGRFDSLISSVSSNRADLGRLETNTDSIAASSSAISSNSADAVRSLGSLTNMFGELLNTNAVDTSSPWLSDYSPSKVGGITENFSGSVAVFESLQGLVDGKHLVFGSASSVALPFMDQFFYLKLDYDIISKFRLVVLMLFSLRTASGLLKMFNSFVRSIHFTV